MVLHTLFFANCRQTRRDSGMSRRQRRWRSITSIQAGPRYSRTEAANGPRRILAQDGTIRNERL